MCVHGQTDRHIIRNTKIRTRRFIVSISLSLSFSLSVYIYKHF